MPNVGFKIREDRVKGILKQDTPYPIPESKTRERPPCGAGIGIVIPSPHIPPFQVSPEFFLSRSVPKLSSTEIARKHSSYYCDPKFFSSRIGLEFLIRGR